MTLEQIEAHLQQANLSQFDKPKADFTVPPPGDVLKEVCKVYNAIRPIIAVIVNFSLTPPSIKSGLTTFMKVMDGICPQK